MRPADRSRASTTSSGEGRSPPPKNLLVRDGRLAAVIDFGLCGVGDPACDTAIACTFLSGPGRDRFQAELDLDAGTWARGRVGST